MSLIRAALRIAAVEALRGRTLVEDNVLDSEAGAIEVDKDGILTTGQEGAFIAVYTYDGETESRQRSALTDNGRVELAVEIGASPAMWQRDETGMRRIEAMPVTDATTEFYLDVVGRQVRDALSDPDNAWADVFNGLRTGIDAIRSQATRHADGQRIAGHQIALTLSVINEPALGQSVHPDAPFGRFLALCEADDSELRRHQATMIRTLLEGVADAYWQALQRRMAVSADELRALGFGPLAQDRNRTTPPFETAVFDLDGRSSTERS